MLELLEKILRGFYAGKDVSGWITPSGRLIDIGNAEHARDAVSRMAKLTGKQYSSDYEAYVDLMQLMGYVRLQVSSSEISATVEKKITSSQLSLIRNYTKDIGLDFYYDVRNHRTDEWESGSGYQNFVASLREVNLTESITESSMDLLEKILRVDEKSFRGEQGFIGPSAERIVVGSHEGYAYDYLKKHKIAVSSPRFGSKVVAKFQSATGNIRYIIHDDEIGFTVVTRVTSAQLRALRIISKSGKKVVFDVVDEHGENIVYGVGLSDLISKLKNMDLLERIDDSLEEWGFINPSGKRITIPGDHEYYALQYLKKHRRPNERFPSSNIGRVALFLAKSGNIRYYIFDEEIGFTIVASVTSAQIRALRAVKGGRVVYDIVDEQGDTIEYGKGIPDLISSLKNMDLLEKILQESSIDFPQESLDPAVWDLEGKIPILREDVKKKILAILEQYPDVSLLEIAEEIRIVGSIGTNQYLDMADVDVHITPKNVEEWDEEKVKKVVQWFNENRDELDAYIEKHPIEVYIQVNPDQDLMSDSCYNLLEEKWLVGPKIVSTSSDPYADFSHIEDDIRNTVEDADKLFGELKRDVIDFEVITAAMERMSGEDKKKLLQRLQGKLEELEIDIDALYTKKAEWVKARKEASSPETPEQALKDVELAKEWRDTNAVFKFIDRYRYFKTINDLKKLLDDEEITAGEVDQIKSIMGA